MPCFYVIAGFLAYKGWSHAASSRLYMQKYLTRLFIIYCFFCCIFAAESIVPKLINGGLTAGNLIVHTFFGHILFMRINLLLLGWSTASMSVAQDFMLLLMTLLECAAFTALFSLGSKSVAAKQTGNLPS